MGYLQCHPRMAELGDVWISHLLQRVLDHYCHRLLGYEIQGEHGPPSVHEEPTCAIHEEQGFSVLEKQKPGTSSPKGRTF